MEYKYQVNFSKRFVSGILKGKVYHDHLKFCSRADAIFFAKRDGLVVSACQGTGDYVQEDSSIINLKEFA